MIPEHRGVYQGDQELNARVLLPKDITPEGLDYVAAVLGRKGVQDAVGEIRPNLQIPTPNVTHVRSPRGGEWTPQEMDDLAQRTGLGFDQSVDGRSLLFVDYMKEGEAFHAHVLQSLRSAGVPRANIARAKADTGIVNAPDYGRVLGLGGHSGAAGGRPVLPARADGDLVDAVQSLERRGIAVPADFFERLDAYHGIPRSPLVAGGGMAAIDRQAWDAESREGSDDLSRFVPRGDAAAQAQSSLAGQFATGLGRGAVGAAGGAAAERGNHSHGQTAPMSADPTYARQAFDDLVAYLAGGPPSPALALALGLTPIPPAITRQTLARLTGLDPSVFLRRTAAPDLPPDLPAWLARYR